MQYQFNIYIYYIGTLRKETKVLLLNGVIM